MKNKLALLFIPIACNLLLAACTKKDVVSEIPDSGKGTVSGIVMAANNHPIKDAKITVEHTVWHASYVFGNSNAGGKYKILIPDDPAGDWTAKAQITKSAYGRTYVFDLEPDKTETFNQITGAVRNFVWKLSGARPGGTGFYGAHVDLYQFGADVDMTNITVAFTPFPGETNLIDGSVAPSFERPVEDVAGTFMVKDVPVGKYTIKLTYPGKKLLLNNRHIDDENEESKTVIFGKNGYLGETEYTIEFFVTE